MNMLIIEIEKVDVKVKSGKSGRTGKEYEIREQSAYVLIPGHKYPQPIKVTLDDDAAPYEPGKYNLSPTSFFVGRFNDLQMRPRLVAVAAPVAKVS